MLSHLQSYLVSLPFVSCHLFFSECRRIGSSKFSTRKSPQFPLGNLCSLVTPAVSLLVFAATDAAFCQTQIFVESSVSLIFFRFVRIQNPTCSVYGHPTRDTSHFILSCSAANSAPLAFWRLLLFIRSLVQALGNYLAFGAL